MRRQLGILIPILLTLFAFQNCKSFDSEKSIDQSSMCIEKKREIAFAEKYWSDVLCEDFAQYRCNLAIFKPDVDTAEYKAEECTRISDKEYCLELDVISFNTNRQLQTSTSPEDAIEGGNYNRLEYTCTHPDLYSKGVAIIQAESDSLRESLKLAQRQCLEGSQ